MIEGHQQLILKPYEKLSGNLVASCVFLLLYSKSAKDLGPTACSKTKMLHMVCLKS